ncbi:MAG: c-type cytochrome [Bacteroidia bacterium]
MKIFNVIFKPVLISTFLFGFVIQSHAQSVEEGGNLFKSNCTSCHAINQKVIGPALKNVHKKYDEQWIIQWVHNSQEFIKSGDAKAVKVFEENNKIPMTSFANFSETQIKSIIAYIKAESEKPEPVASAGSSGGVGGSSDHTDYSDGVNWLLFLATLVLVIVIVQIFSILEKLGEIKGKPLFDWNRINSVIVILFLIVGMAAATWEFIIHTPLTVNAHEPASAHGAIYDSMFNITLLLTGIVFIITQVLLFWYSFKYKHSEKRKALYYPDNHKLEYIWTIIPAIVLTVLVIRGLKTWTSITDRNQAKDAQVIEVFGYQFDWKMRYAGADNKLGAHDFRKMGVVNEFGVDPNDNNAKDDMISNELHLVVGQPVVLKFRAKDVIHSAYMPHFRVQMNVVPGLPTQFIFTPTITTIEMRTKLKNQNFDYVLLCNKICGSAHYRMNRKVVVESRAEYNTWMNSQTKLADISTAAKAESKSLALK